MTGETAPNPESYDTVDWDLSLEIDYYWSSPLLQCHLKCSTWVGGTWYDHKRVIGLYVNDESEDCKCYVINGLLDQEAFLNPGEGGCPSDAVSCKGNNNGVVPVGGTSVEGSGTCFRSDQYKPPVASQGECELCDKD